MSRTIPTLFICLLSLLSLFVSTAHGQGGATNQPAREAIRLEKEAEAAKERLENPREDVFTGTIFNGEQVPPMIELSGKTMKEDISEGYWFVEAFSPYCHHCKSLAPKLQTIYEFYYTSNPLPASSEPVDSRTSLNSFSRYYNIRFAKLDCVAFGTACGDLKVQSYPSMILLKDGEEVKRTTGDRDMVKLSAFIEECLEIIRPGSRPVGGLPELPTAGVSSFSTNQVTVDAAKVGSLGDSTPAKPSKGLPKPTRPTNSEGISEPLTAESFPAIVSKSLDPWFVKFYAPWCPHCQRMAASWKDMAKEMKGKLNVGEVNCDVDKKLCRDMGVRGYPTIVYYRGPDQIDYQGLRGLGDLIDYANKATEATKPVQDVTLEEFEVMEKTEEVIFTYFYDHATTSEDYMALERLSIKLIDHAKLVKTSDPAMIKRFKINTWPRLLVSRKGKVSVFDPLMPQDIRNIDRVTDWMRKVWLPLVPEVTASNARQLMSGKYVVLAILDRNRKEAFAVAQRELETAVNEWMERFDHTIELERQELRDAKQLRIEEAQDRDDERGEMNAKRIRIDVNDLPHKEVTFAWVDGVFWERWVKTQFGITVAEGERVIINDEDNQRYWDSTVTGNPIVPSRTSILETLPRVLASPPKLQSKPSGATLRVYLYRARNSVRNHPWIGIVVAVVMVVVLLLIWGRRRRRREFGNGGFFTLNGSATNGLLPSVGVNSKGD